MTHLKFIKNAHSAEIQSNPHRDATFLPQENDCEEAGRISGQLQRLLYNLRDDFASHRIVLSQRRIDIDSSLNNHSHPTGNQCRSAKICSLFFLGSSLVELAKSRSFVIATFEARFHVGRNAAKMIHKSAVPLKIIIGFFLSILSFDSKSLLFLLS